MHAPNDYGMIENMAFSCFAQATEGDLTVGQQTLNKAASTLAYNWVYNGKNPNNIDVCKSVCNQIGFDFDSLTNEEVDYLAKQTERKIGEYYAT